MTYTALINIMPLTELLDPQGKAVNSSLHNLGMPRIQDVRIGKHITLLIESENPEAAREVADEACRKMLCNAVMEKYSIVIE
jgi:phosphoribosylformylglycinamidine synthase